MVEDIKYSILTVYHLETLNKVWGVVVNDQNSLAWSNRTFYTYYWCWWAEIGKGISVNRHRYNMWRIDSHIKKKELNQYKPISQDQLLELWPDFWEKLNQRLIFESLSSHE